MVCTYNSSPSVATAVKDLDFAFDLVVADEVHRCAGVENSSHQTVLHNARIPATLPASDTGDACFTTDAGETLCGYDARTWCDSIAPVDLGTVGACREVQP